MFFKKRISVSAYCEAALRALFDAETAQEWKSFKSDSHDAVLREAYDGTFLDELRGAHLQLLSLAIAKQYRDIDLTAEAYMCASAFLKTHASVHIEAAKDAYNKAFGSSASDGVLEMARLFGARLGNGRFSEQTLSSIHDLMYKSLSSYFADFKSLKLVKS